MLKGGTSPLLLFQKLSRWYSAYSGVVLRSLLGLLASILEFYEFTQVFLCEGGRFIDLLIRRRDEGFLRREIYDEILIIELIVDPAVSSSTRLRWHFSRPASSDGSLVEG